MTGWWRIRCGLSVAVALALLCVGSWTEGGSARVAAGSLAQKMSRYSRVDDTRRKQAKSVDAAFAKAGAPYPTPLLVRAFKEEGDLEVWAFDPVRGRYVRIERVPFTGYSGDLGPKRRRWDRQIPEGFYRVRSFNGASRFHLSLELDYPNASDRLLADRRHPGNNIFIHGDEWTNGCIPIGNRAIERLFLAALDSRSAGHQVEVHIFPCRFEREGCARLLRNASAKRPKLRSFWQSLEKGYRHFEEVGVPAVVVVEPDGRYAFVGGEPQAAPGSASIGERSR
jgi:murein L,D-transpeptidase YafK